MKWCQEKGGGTWGGMIFRKGRVLERWRQRRFGQDNDGFCPSGEWRYIGHWVLSCYGNRCNHTHTHTFSLPICHFHSLALTQYYPSHHSSCVIPLRDTNWTLSLHDCLATWLIFHPSFEPGVRKTRGEERQWRGTRRARRQSCHVWIIPVRLREANGTRRT